MVSEVICIFTATVFLYYMLHTTPSSSILLLRGIFANLSSLPFDYTTFSIFICFVFINDTIIVLSVSFYS